MRLLLVIDSLRRHGTQRFLALLARGLAARGHRVDVVALNRAEADPALARALAEGTGRPPAFIGLGWLAAGVGLARLFLLLLRARRGTVLTLLPASDTLARPLARLAGARRVVSSIRARNEDKPAWQRRLDRLTMPLAHTVIFNSAEVVAWSREHEGVRDAQVAVIPNGVEPPPADAAAARAQTRAALGVPADALLVGAVGRLYPQKNHALLLDAFARVAPDFPSARLVVIGDGPLRGALAERAARADLAGRVQLAGARDDVPACLAALDAFAHTPDFEGQPNAVLEAMAAGLPVAATAVDGCVECLDRGACGLLSPPGDAGAFAASLRRLLSDPALRAALGAAARARAAAEYTVARMVDRYEAVLFPVPASGAASGAPSGASS